MKSLHHECQILQFVLQDRQSASGHFNPAGRIQSRSLRNSVPPPHQKDLQELGTKMKKLLATGGTVKDGIVLLQGDHRDRVVEILVKRGFSEASIEVI